MDVKVRIYNTSKFDLPTYETFGASGMDVRANESVVIPPNSTIAVDTGLMFGLPTGYEIQVRPRSGISLKTPLRLANSVGTLDSDYRGRLKILLWNSGDTPFPVNEGERIAQIVLAQVPKMYWEPVDTPDALGETKRGTGGFGSTGTK